MRHNSNDLSTLFNRSLSDCNLLAIMQGGKWVFNPSMQHIVNDRDVLMVMTTPQGLKELEHLIHSVPLANASIYATKEI